MTRPTESAQKAPDATKGVPQWAYDPFRDFFSEIERQSDLLEVSTRGISLIDRLPKWFEILTSNTAMLDKVGKLTERGVRLAQREIESGFPLLHSYAALAVWASLEAATRLFVVRWIQNQPSAIEVDAIQRLKVRISDYEALKGEDRYFYIVDRLEQEHSAPLRGGINRFEVILEPFGFAGDVDQGVQRDLFELSQVRNSIMHRAGKADRRLIEACPWLALSNGQPLIIDHRAVTRYFEAAGHYATDVFLRVAEFFGDEVAESRQILRSRLGKDAQ